LQTHHEEGDTERAQNTTHIVDLAEDFLGGALHGEWNGVFVEEDDQNQAHEVPGADENPDISPVTGSLRDELCPQRRRAEGQNGENDQTDVHASLGGGDHFGGSSQGDQFVEAGAEATDNHAADSHVHRLRGRDDDGSDEQTYLAERGDPAPSEQIRQGTDEGAEGRVGDQVADNHPQVLAVRTANLGVDVGQHGSVEIEGDLRADPQKGHGRQCQEELRAELVARSAPIPSHPIPSILHPIHPP
jgi:hypothetical protein